MGQVYMKMVGKEIRKGVRKVLWMSGTTSGKVEFMAVPYSLWRIYFHYLSSVVGNAQPLKKSSSLTKGERFLLSSEEQLLQCCSFFGSSFFSYDKMLRSGPGDLTPLLVGIMKISFVIAHRYGERKKPMEVCYEEEDGKVVIRFSVCYRLVNGMLNRGRDGRPHQLKEVERELKERLRKEEEEDDELMTEEDSSSEGEVKLVSSEEEEERD